MEISEKARKYFRKMGKIGGKKLVEKRGVEYMREIGKKGVEARKKKHDNKE